MRISRITVYARTLPLAEPYFLSGGRLRFEALDSTFLRIDTDEGLIGWGEGCPWGHSYLPASGPGTRAALEILAPAILGADPRSPDHIARLMDTALPGHLYAKSPIDIACWDILGQFAGLPLWQLFGGDAPHPVPVNSSISTGTPDEMMARIEKARAQGYATHSAKIGGSDPRTDIARIEAISAAMRPGEQVTFDVNRAWTPGVALRVLGAVAARDWVEQPCETMEECAFVAGKVPQPVLLDECLHGEADPTRAWAMGAFAGLKIKPGRVGGLTRARRLRDFALSVGWQMHIEDVGGTVLADTAAIHLAAATPASHRMASWLSHAHLADDPMPGQGARNHGGHAAPPSDPGLGVVPDPDAFGAPVAAYG